MNREHDMVNGFQFPGRIRSLRAHYGYSQAQLADLVGVSKTTISNYERGNSKPGWDHIVALASALDCRMEVLFADDIVRAIMTRKTPKEKEMQDE